MATFDSGAVTLTWREVDYAALVHRLCASFESVAEDAGIAWSVDVPPGPVRGEADEARVAGMLTNLLANACKYTPRGGGIRCSLSRDDTTVSVEVADSGPGIPLDLRDAVFERFRKLDEVHGSARFGGTGLGLSIVKETVELHGGRVSVGAAEEGGASFRLTLPCRAPAGTADGPAVSPAAAVGRPGTVVESHVITAEAAVATSALTRARRLAQPKEPDGRPVVMVVEDNLDLADYIGQELGGEYQIVFAADGAEAWDTLQGRNVDLILTDLMMPRMDGESLLTRVRGDAAYDRVPVVVLTARADPDLRVRLLRLGASDFLPKPFSAAELLVRVGNVMAAAMNRQRLEGQVTQRTADLEEVNRLLAHQATHDQLTGLSNRAVLLSHLARWAGGGAGAVLVGVDDLNRVDDVLGHRAADRVLAEVADRLRDLADADHVLARVGGAEFALVCKDAGTGRSLAALAEHILRVLRAPVTIDGHTVVVTASVGTARPYAGSDSADVLLRDAGLAMHLAKSHGGDRYQVFDEQLRVSALARLTTEQGLRTALAGNQFRLHYQPEVRLTDGGVSGFEALIRWHHPDRGLLTPGTFLPVARSAGLIEDIDTWVLETGLLRLPRAV